MSDLNVALQLYSVRDDMERDFEGTLRAVRDIGYEWVEFAGYFGRAARDVRALLDSLGMRCASVHQGYEVFLEDERANIDYLKEIGARYCAVPWMGTDRHKGAERFEQTVRELTQVGRALKAAGITLLYHNHDFEFERFQGEYLLDWLYRSIDADILKTQIDTCWARYAGVDPVGYILKYAGRSPVVHLKDFTAGDQKAGPVYALIDDEGREIEKDGASAAFHFRPLGMGVQDFPAILDSSKKAGAQFVVVEQDESPDMPPLEAARLSREYLKTLGI